MPIAIVSKDGYIKQVKVKIQPFDKLEQDDRVCEYSVPEHNSSIHIATPIEPVIGDSVTFILSPHPDALENSKRMYTQEIQKHLDKKAQERGYDSILQAVSYATDPNQPFYQEALAYSQWRSQCWVTGYSIINEVVQGHMQVPQDQTIIGLLPPLTI